MIIWSPTPRSTDELFLKLLGPEEVDMREHSSAPAVGVNGGRREDLKSVAKYQKGILWCILIQLLGGLCAAGR